MFIKFEYGLEKVYLNISNISRMVVLNEALTIHTTIGETYEFTKEGCLSILDMLQGGYIMEAK